jgi:hypothetical protein
MMMDQCFYGSMWLADRGWLDCCCVADLRRVLSVPRTFRALSPDGHGKFAGNTRDCWHVVPDEEVYVA